MSREEVGESFLRLLSHGVLCLGVTYPKAYHKKQLIITILPHCLFSAFFLNKRYCLCCFTRLKIKIISLKVKLLTLLI